MVTKSNASHGSIKQKNSLASITYTTIMRILNTPPCNWRGKHTIGTCGGRLQPKFVPLVGITLRMI